MRIDGTGRVIATRQTGTAARSSGAAFRPEGGAAPQRAVENGAIAASTGIEGLLALQAAEDATAGRRKAIKRGALLLDALEDMRADLLVGQVSEGRLHRAMALLGQARSHSEPGLDAVIADIELRVRVELAKLGTYLPA